jgi:hypothetical protein
MELIGYTVEKIVTQDAVILKFYEEAVGKRKVNGTHQCME